MSYDAKTERLIALKKLAGKAQTSNDKGLANEALPSGITMASTTVFGETVSSSPVNSSLYTITGKVEYIRFPVAYIAGSDTSDGRHGFELKLPSDYESNSSNTKAGTYPFQNNQAINITSGSLQLVPPAFSATYEVKPYYGGSSTKDSGTQIPLLDARDWYLDYFNGVFFQQDPSGTGDQADNPDYVEGFLYIGDMLDTVVSNTGGSGGGDGAAQYLVLSATSSLSAERVFTAGTGISTTDAGSGGAYTVGVNNSIVATLTGSEFSGNVSVAGILQATGGISGSLTQLNDGTSYLIAGSNVTIASGSSGAITITATGGIDGSGAANRIATWSDADTLTSDSDLTWNGTTLYASSGGTTLNVQGDANLNGTVVINQSGVDKDFRVETQNKSNALHVDGGTDMVLLFSGSLTDAAGHGSSASDPDPRTFNDTNFFVSGAIDSRGTSTRGTSVFGGDILVSGTLAVKTGITGSLTHIADGTSYLIAGSNVTIASGSSGAITISSSGGGSTRSKFVYDVTASHVADSNLEIPSINFSSVSYNDQKIDIFVNGQLMSSGSTKDYLIPSYTTGSVNFKFELLNEDIVTAFLY